MPLSDHLRAITLDAIGWRPPTRALVVSDRRSPLARRLADAWALALPDAEHVDVDLPGPLPLPDRFDALPRGSLVVLVQSTRFELGEFRFRLELFKRGLAVVELAHLARIPEAEIPIYEDALAYDAGWFRGAGAALKARLDPARSVRVVTAAGEARWRGPFEAVRQNVGDYAGLPNVGGQFPIGEVFTEPVALDAVEGTVTLAAYGAADFSVSFVEPFPLVIRAGRVTDAPGAPAAFHDVLATIAAAEGEVWVRELGFGLNRALTATRRLHDVSAYERMCGIHLSLGAKHPVFPKPGFNKRHTRFHVDVFVAAPEVFVDDVCVYAEGAYRLG